MREITPEECKKLQLNILINVAKFCDEHDIKYSLAYGTLIGAIRHNGFIPWDDDIDIIMMRDEYERFVSLYKDEKYVLIHGENMSNHLHVVVSDLSTKLEFFNRAGQSHFYHGGLWVDIFPIDNAPSSIIKFKVLKKVIRYACIMHRCSQFSYPHCSLPRRMAYLLLRPFEKLLSKMPSALVKAYDTRNTGTLANFSIWRLNFPPFPISYMNEFVKVEFEGNKFKAIKEYDSFLKGIYGDYMILPPIEERINKHSFKAYWRE